VAFTMNVEQGHEVATGNELLPSRVYESLALNARSIQVIESCRLRLSRGFEDQLIPAILLSQPVP
jgi:hypothetical protein